MKLFGRFLHIGRSKTERGDGVVWFRYGLWFSGRGDFIPVGGQRRFSIEYDPGAPRENEPR